MKPLARLECVGRSIPPDKLDPSAVARKYGYATPDSAARFLLELFLQGDVEPGEPFAHMVENRLLVDALVKKAKALGIDVPLTLQASADEVIE